MHTIALGTARAHFNSDFSGEIIFSDGKGEIRVPGQLVINLAERYRETKDSLNPIPVQTTIGNTAPSSLGKWRLEGYDTFEGGPDAYYPLDGEYDSEDAAKTAASQRLEELESSQPTKTSGGQSGIQDQVYIVSPDGKRTRFIG